MPANEILAARYNSVLHKTFDMKDTAPSPTLAPEIVPMICLEMDRPEWYFLGGMRRGMGTASPSAVAAQRSQVRIVNVNGSGVLLVVEQVWARTAAAATINVVVQTGVTAGFSGAASVNIDMRGPSGTIGRVDQRTAAFAPTSLWTPSIPAAVSTKIIDFPIILPPNSELIWCPSADNVAMDGAVMWRERELPASETR